AIFNDQTARALREIVWPVAPTLATVTAVLYPWLFPHIPELQLIGYGAMLFTISLSFWLRRRKIGELIAVITTLAVSPLAYLRWLILLLGQTPLASGLPWLASGAVMVSLALAISCWKMGLWQRVWQRIQYLNIALSSRQLEGFDD